MSESTKDSLRIAVVQMTSTEDVDQNAQTMQEFFKQAVAGGAELVSYPENCLYLRINDQADYFALEFTDSRIQKMADLSRNHRVAAHLGSVPLWRDGKIFNTTLFIDSDGVVTSVYDKMHLFDIELDDHKAIKESDYFNHGAKPHILEWGGFRFGLSICYDLRFSPLYAYYAQQKVDALLVPAAFLVPTGKAHWQTLLKARAIECQAYVFAAAQAGTHVYSEKIKRRSYGHSMAIDPWGDVLALIEDQPGVIYAELRKSRLQEVRRQMPMASHRRDIKGE